MIETLAYEGARQGRREENWIVGAGTSANVEIANDRLRLRDRVRTLRRNNPYAVKAVSVLVANRVGTGILAAADGPNKRANARINDRWERWIERCDYTGNTDYYGIQALAETCRIEAGECFIRMRQVPQTASDDIGLRLQVLEPDHLDTNRNESSNGVDIREGIEYIGGLPVAYWLHPTHPGDYSPVFTRTTESVRVPAKDVLHYYRVERPGQLTGVTELAPVIRRLYDLDGYEDAELMRKKIAACAVSSITTQNELPGASMGPTTVASDGRRQEQWSPGMRHYLRPGEIETFFDPKPTPYYKEFFGVELHAIAAGLGMPYELLTGDLSEVTYTSHRGGLVQFRANVEADQWQLVIPQICQPIWDRFVNEIEMGPMPVRVPAKFTPPRFGLLDPAKEIPAMIEAIQGGLSSWQDTIRREGNDPMKVFEEIVEDRKMFGDEDINVTSIPQMPQAPPPGTPPEDEDDEEDEAA